MATEEKLDSLMNDLLGYLIFHVILIHLSTYLFVVIFTTIQ